MIEIYEDLGMYYEGLINIVRKGREKELKKFRI
jgi:phosphoglucomutase